jgi:ribosomal protein S18 acetylase RimI-like enzyme
MLRPARETDFKFLRALSQGPSDDALKAQIRDGRLRIFDAYGRAIGFLKFVVLWEQVPFVELIFLGDADRGQGFGSEMMRAWETEMAGKGFARVLTSTQGNETAQVFWRKLGYEDCGSLERPGMPAELFLEKQLVVKRRTRKTKQVRGV